MLKSRNGIRNTSRKRRVLIVDDELINRELLKLILEDEYDTLTAPDGETALEVAREYGEYASVGAAVRRMKLELHRAARTAPVGVVVRKAWTEVLRHVGVRAGVVVHLSCSFAVLTRPSYHVKGCKTKKTL